MIIDIHADQRTNHYGILISGSFLELPPKCITLMCGVLQAQESKRVMHSHNIQQPTYNNLHTTTHLFSDLVTLSGSFICTAQDCRPGLPPRTAAQDCRPGLPPRTAAQDCRPGLPPRTAAQDCRLILDIVYHWSNDPRQTMLWASCTSVSQHRYLGLLPGSSSLIFRVASET